MLDFNFQRLSTCTCFILLCSNFSPTQLANKAQAKRRVAARPSCPQDPLRSTPVRRHLAADSSRPAVLKPSHASRTLSLAAPLLATSASMPYSYWLEQTSVRRRACLRSRPAGPPGRPSGAFRRRHCACARPQYSTSRGAARSCACALLFRPPPLPPHPRNGSAGAAAVPSRRCSRWTKWRRSPRPTKVKGRNPLAAVLFEVARSSRVFLFLSSPNAVLRGAGGRAGGGRTGPARNGVGARISAMAGPPPGARGLRGRAGGSRAPPLAERRRPEGGS